MQEYVVRLITAGRKVEENHVMITIYVTAESPQEAAVVAKLTYPLFDVYEVEKRS